MTFISCKFFNFLDFYRMHIFSFARSCPSSFFITDIYNDIYIETLKEWNIIFGKFDINDNFTLITNFLLLGKNYIYSKKCQSSLPSAQGFIARIKLIYRIELQIAREKNKLSQHFVKWRKLVEVLT